MGGPHKACGRRCRMLPASGTRATVTRQAVLAHRLDAARTSVTRIDAPTRHAWLQNATPALRLVPVSQTRDLDRHANTAHLAGASVVRVGARDRVGKARRGRVGASTHPCSTRAVDGIKRALLGCRSLRMRPGRAVARLCSMLLIFHGQPHLRASPDQDVPAWAAVRQRACVPARMRGSA